MQEKDGVFRQKLERVLKNFNEMSTQLSSEGISPQDFTRLSKEYSDLTPLAESIERFFKVEQEMEDLSEMLKDSELDEELKSLSFEELEALKQAYPAAMMAIKVLLLPKDEVDERNAILEVRAGTGGDEAALFASDLFRMYQRYAEVKGWRFEMMDVSDTGMGGLKEATATITGKGVFARLKFESGVHRVQRVPETEASGRIHTSAATVAVLPEAEEVDIVIEEKDLKIDVFRSSGPGGQSVNTTDSAVRITHLPTGVVVQQQDEKSQHKNKAKALKILRARLFERKRLEQDALRAQNRKSQVGSGDRSERIRTYNFPQGRVTDHRINLTLYKLDKVLSGESLDEFVEALIAEDQATRLAEEDV
ncbi:MAG: peptide chain release factor 1 [Alphaproteobacteria bacterium]|mgnify:CR=1 FL=1|nr:peptide chain release factor 1 [Alphaproteobacteria bacterium]OJV47148.1 MAG: peptide chain release factor 1 [Alphaproteobacteria bacterium 43-37]